MNVASNQAAAEAEAVEAVEEATEAIRRSMLNDFLLDFQSQGQ